MPNHLIIDLPEKNIRPGKTFHGNILWDLESAPRSIHLGFGWWTSGRGDRDEVPLDHCEWTTPSSIGKEPFSFTVPELVVPSFSGRLISVEWGIQLSAQGVRVDDIVEILTISPLRREINISGETYQSKGESFPFRKGRSLSLPNRR